MPFRINLLCNIVTCKKKLYSDKKNIFSFQIFLCDIFLFNGGVTCRQTDIFLEICYFTRSRNIFIVKYSEQYYTMKFSLPSPVWFSQLCHGLRFMILWRFWNFAYFQDFLFKVIIRYILPPPLWLTFLKHDRVLNLFFLIKGGPYSETIGFSFPVHVVMTWKRTRP